ncbi:hypothetical protein DM860_004691 [Cuscuta australis]|uniref:Uncharacterized protein n=1 Tax=Cuscuta australis TaxID=267555 RepID=A0A328E9F5_9ASTE|nr:hypothetical protein DM860_004691 [Cuscuta australis]
MSEDNSILLVAYWSSEIQVISHEVQYSELPKKSLLFNSDVSYDTFLGKISSDVIQDGFQGVESVFVEVFIVVSKNVEEEVEVEEDGSPFFQQPMDQPSSSHYAQHFDSDPDDAEYVAPLEEDEGSLEEEEDISSDEGDEGDNEVAMPHLEEVQRRETHRSLQPTFHVPIIEVGNTYPSFQSLQEAVSLRNIAEHRHFRTVSKRSRYWRASCVYTPQCTWFIQAVENAGTSIWTIKQYHGYHQCRPDYTRAKDDKLLTSELISTLIGPKIQEDADYKVKLIIRDIYELFQISVSYKKHHAQQGIYSVVVDGSSYIAQRETFTVNLNARTCSCGQWSYINAYSGIIMPLPDESQWPTPEYEILRPTPRQSTRTGRRTRTCYPNNMDYRPRRRPNEE